MSMTHLAENRCLRSVAAAGLLPVLLPVLLILLPPEASAVEIGGALIYPKRVVLSGRVRSAEVTLVNPGTQSLTYRIGFVELRMTPAGGLVEVGQGEAGDRSARPLIRFAPRQVTVAPDSAQKIRLALRKPAELAAGEYRSHLHCRTLPPADLGHDVERLDQEDGFSVRLQALPAISIPVIVRHGELQAEVSLDQLVLEPAAATVADSTVADSTDTDATDTDSTDTTVPMQLGFRLHRTGQTSVYGDLSATLIAPDGNQTVVGLARGIAIYPPLTAISRKLLLTPPAGTSLEHGRLRLRFDSNPAEDGGITLQAEAELVLP